MNELIGIVTPDDTYNLSGQVSGESTLSGIVTGGAQYEAYAGSYSVTPSGSVQTLETDGKLMADDVTVGAIPSDYIGTDIPRRSSISVSQDNNTIHVEDGYYEDDIDTSMGACTVTGASVSIDSQGDATGSIIVGRGGYINSGSHAFYVDDVVTPRSSSDLTVSGATVSVPYGYYSADASKTVASGSAGTPTATKGSVSNHAVNVTPSVTNTTGYITGGTKTGTAVTVSASELDSGTKSITANGNSQDVVGYASVNVNVPNSYSPTDEGKVVSNGTLVSQTSATYTENDTYDTTLVDEVTVNVSGGGGTQIGIETPKANLLSMIYALEQGTAKTGTFTLSTTLPSTKQVIFDADDSTVKNFAIFEQDIGVEILEQNNVMSKMRVWLYDTNTSARTFFSVTDRVRASYKDYVTATPSNVDLTSTYYDNSYWFFEDGVLSAQGQYNKHQQYTPFRANVVYRWIAW